MAANLYVRVKPYNPRQGYILNRYHFLGNLFVGGARPTWYRVTQEYADFCREDRQETGLPAFDIVTEAEKLEIDAKEEQLRLVELGLLSATINAPHARQPIDIREVKPAEAKPALSRGASRTDAVPLQTSKEISGPGDLNTDDLRMGAK